MMLRQVTDGSFDALFRYALLLVLIQVLCGLDHTTLFPLPTWCWFFVGRGRVKEQDTAKTQNINIESWSCS